MQASCASHTQLDWRNHVMFAQLISCDDQHCLRCYLQSVSLPDDDVGDRSSHIPWSNARLTLPCPLRCRLNAPRVFQTPCALMCPPSNAVDHSQCAGVYPFAVAMQYQDERFSKKLEKWRNALRPSLYRCQVASPSSWPIARKKSRVSSKLNQLLAILGATFSKLGSNPLYMPSTPSFATILETASHIEVYW